MIKLKKIDLPHGGVPHHDLSAEKQNNLMTLADFLWNMSENADERGVSFRMDVPCALIRRGDHHINPMPFDLMKPECGTAACALGHGPIAGIKPYSTELWGEYSQRCFVHPNTKAFQFIFAERWPNDPKFAAIRIYYLLQHGVPLASIHQMNIDQFIAED